jgi:hypothetical protein
MGAVLVAKGLCHGPVWDVSEKSEVLVSGKKPQGAVRYACMSCERRELEKGRTRD